MARIIGVTVLINILGLTFAWFESCDKTFNLQLGKSIQINSPNYPNSLYPPGSSCRYKITSPNGTQIQLQCQIQLASGSCQNEYFYIASDGNLTLPNSEHFCGTRSITRNSAYSELAMGYRSTTTKSYASTGNFTCIATVQHVPCDCGWSVSTRIVGGENALLNEYTSIVALVSPSSESIFCGGTIISPRMVLTAASCLDVIDVVLLVGELHFTKNTKSPSPYRKVYLCKRFIIHPKYSSSTAENNIGLIETTQPILFSRGVGPACLLLSPTFQSLENVIVEAAGWGATEYIGASSNTLKKVSLTVISNSVCAKSYGQISQLQICTYTPGNDTCQYDTGGPVYMRGTRLILVGVVSHGYGCGWTKPTVHTRVSEYVHWIGTHVCSALCMKKEST